MSSRKPWILSLAGTLAVLAAPAAALDPAQAENKTDAKAKAASSFTIGYDDGTLKETPKSEEEPITIIDAAQSTTTTTTEINKDPQILWPGFLWGLRGFDEMPKPVGMPFYFEDPFINTSFNFVYLWNKFPDGSALKGGDMSSFITQIRVALTERLQLVASEHGYTLMRARRLPSDDGWNDFSFGLKYAIYYDIEQQFILSGGLRWKWNNGHTGVLMGNDDELSPYLSFAKGWDKFHMIGSVTGRIPMDRHDSNYSLVTSLHFDYELFENFFPLLEFHYIQYLSDADKCPLSVAGADFANFGSNDAAGRSSFFGGVGFRYKITPTIELGTVYNFPLMNPKHDVIDHRVTVSMLVGL